MPGGSLRSPARSAPAARSTRAVISQWSLRSSPDRCWRRPRHRDVREKVKARRVRPGCRRGRGACVPHPGNRYWHRALRCRSQKTRLTQGQMNRYVTRWLPLPESASHSLKHASPPPMITSGRGRYRKKARASQTDISGGLAASAEMCTACARHPVPAETGEHGQG